MILFWADTETDDGMSAKLLEKSIDFLFGALIFFVKVSRFEAVLPEKETSMENPLVLTL
ncbi:MAG: hypothetical protein FWC57_06705 [Endomicrobia bacterium]|nr:hypothetical protein [Endomicrobiia bacterium]